MKYLMNISGEIPHAGLNNINIPLNGRNLIITGKNGSGKTSFLNKLNEKLSLHFSKEIQQLQQYESNLKYYEQQITSNPVGSYQYSEAQRNIEYMLKEINKISESLKLDFENEFELLSFYDAFKAIHKSFEAMRKSDIQHVTSSTSIQVEKDQARNNIFNNLGKKLEQHLINIRVNKAFAFEKNDKERFNILDEWFKQFDIQLKFLFENDTAKLIFNEQNFKFKVQLNEREFEFQNLSSGYQAIFDIFADLLVRSEFFEISPLELRGIVIIDEIDAHLHISLQKKILPFFTKLFPQIQFIVSTHSPFVITSTDNDTVVYDISSGEFFEEDLSHFSHESIIKELFHVKDGNENLKALSDQLVNFIEVETPSHDLEVIQNLLNEINKNFDKLSVELQLQYMIAKDKLKKLKHGDN